MINECLAKDIVITGPKHSGKTSAGKILASLCSCDFFDTDELIFQNTGKSPRQLFNENPESFKKAEAEATAALFRVQSRCRRVIAAGGGVIDNPEAADIIASSGAVVAALDISVSAAWQRIVSSGELPPFINTENLPLPFGNEESHRALHIRRSATYREFASIVIETDDKSPKDIAGEIYYKLSF